MDVRDLLLQFLRDNQLPESLLGFIEEAIAAQKPFEQILSELRQTPEYLSAYPENAARIENGLSWMPEGEIRAMRDEIRRLSKEYMDVSDVSAEELTQVIGSGWSLRTFETKLQRLQEFERWGPSVQLLLEQELGYRPDDERLFAFFDDTPTPELDDAYRNALVRGQPAVLGLGIRPQEEADILRQFGISPEQAFKGYQDLAAELPRNQRLGLIDAEIARGTFPDGSQLFNDQSFSTLFKAIQLRDMDALGVLQSQLAREVARFQGQGGAARDNSGASIGLLSEEERTL